MVSTLSDEWHQLHGALRNVRGIRGLPEEEREQVDDAIRLIETALRSVGQRPKGEFL
jgi:hypothetical protein